MLMLILKFQSRFLAELETNGYLSQQEEFQILKQKNSSELFLPL